MGSSHSHDGPGIVFGVCVVLVAEDVVGGVPEAVVLVVFQRREIWDGNAVGQRLRSGCPQARNGGIMVESTWRL